MPATKTIEAEALERGPVAFIRQVTRSTAKVNGIGGGWLGFAEKGSANRNKLAACLRDSRANGGYRFLSPRRERHELRRLGIIK